MISGLRGSMSLATEPPAPQARSKARALFMNIGLSAAVLLVIAALAEPILRVRYAEPVRPTPPVVHEVMPLLRTNAGVGFTWEPNIGVDRKILLHNADIVYEPLTTDEFGVWNTPDAIAQRSAGDPVQVIGLGDSFMEMAAPGFHRAFAQRGLFYYSLAIHRQAPPQYLRFLEEPGISVKPKTALVGLFENDFLETADFDAWTGSGMDWFTYHSGTWFGPPAITNPLWRLAHTWLRGYEGFTNVIRVRLRGERMSVTGPTDSQVIRVAECTKQMAEIAQKNSIDLWLVLIPSKPTARGETTPEATAFDRVVTEVEPVIAGVIDLRNVFQAHADPASLYYREDGHWNDAGIALAAETILSRLESETAEGTSISNESGSH